MDFITVTIAGVLLAILLAWYALLEYLERRRREDVEPSDPPLASRDTGRHANNGTGGDVS